MNTYEKDIAFYTLSTQEKSYILQSISYCLRSGLNTLKIETLDGIPHPYTCGHKHMHQGFEYIIMIESDEIHLQKTQAVIEKGYAVEYRSDFYSVVNDDFIFECARVSIPK